MMSSHEWRWDRAREAALQAFMRRLLPDQDQKRTIRTYRRRVPEASRCGNSRHLGLECTPPAEEVGQLYSFAMVCNSSLCTTSPLSPLLINTTPIPRSQKPCTKHLNPMVSPLWRKRAASPCPFSSKPRPHRLPSGGVWGERSWSTACLPRIFEGLPARANCISIMSCARSDGVVHNPDAASAGKMRHLPVIG